MLWKYTFDNYSSALDKQPPQVPPGRFAEVWGVDGRFDGVLRRFPGFLSYEGLPGNLGRSASAQNFDPDLVEYFEINKELGSDVLYRGWLVADRSTGELEMWYKSSATAAGAIAKTTFSERYAGLATIPTSGAVTVTGHAVGGVLSGNGAGPKSSPEVAAMVYGKVGDLPNALYAGTNDFSHAGSRNIAIHSPGVAMLREGRWEPVGPRPVFGQETAFLTSLVIFEGKLWASFSDAVPGITRAGAASAIWYFDGLDWTRYADAPTTSGVNAMYVFANRLYFDDGTDTPYIDGNLALQTGPTGLSSFLTAVDGFTTDGTNLYAFGTGDTGQLPIVYCTSATNWGAVGAGTNSPGTATRSRCSIVNGSTLHVFAEDSGSPYFVHRSRTTGTISSTVTWTVHGTDTTNQGIYVKSAYIRSSSEMVLLGSFDNIFSVATSGVVRWQHVSSYAAESGLDNGSIGLCAATDGTTVYIGGNLDFTTATKTLAIPENGYFSTATRGPYLYVYMSNGNHKVIYYDQTTAGFVCKRLGPGATAMPAPKVIIGSAASGGNAVAGNHLYLQRYVDLARKRYMALTDIEVEEIPMVVDYQVPIIDKLGTLCCLDFDGFQRLEMFRSLSSGNTAVPAGGSIYRAGRFSFGTNGDYAMNMHLSPTSDRGEGDFDCGISDAQLPVEADRLYNFSKEFVAEIGAVYAAAYYQGTSFVLSARDGFLELRWSPTFREEPENFPPLNAFSTKIPVDAALSCRLIEAGDFLYIIGGNFIYRAQKSGSVVIVVEVHQGIPILHRNGIVRVGGRVYIASELGLLELEGRTGNLQDVPNTQRIFYDRWRGSLKAADASNSVRLGYDARMNCVFVLHPTLRECLCFWVTTGKTTMLAYMPYVNIVTGADLNDNSTEKAYFLTNRRWFASANWNHTAGTPQTMNGEFLVRTATTTPYNCLVSSTSLNPGTGVTEVTIKGDTPFAYDGSTVTDFTPCFVAILTGAYAHTITQVAYLTANAITITGEFPLLEEDDVLALAPIVFGVIGSNLWGPKGYADTTSRRSIKSFSVTPARVKTFPLGSSTPPGESSMLWYGAMRHEDVIANEPKSLAYDPLVTPRSSAVTPPGTPLDTDQVHKNTAFLKHVDGAQLYPFVFCLQSNVNLELHELTLTGEYTMKDRPGPGT